MTTKVLVRAVSFAATGLLWISTPTFAGTAEQCSGLAQADCVKKSGCGWAENKCSAKVQAKNTEQPAEQPVSESDFDSGEFDDILNDDFEADSDEGF